MSAPDPFLLGSIRPSARQLAWQRLEFTGFLHFGMNTMTGREWGDGTEDPALFDPADLDADEWVAACADAGMRGVLLTAKHHDGFALWPTATTSHSVAASPWRGGRGDVVREVADACRRLGLRFGVYLSPWDRNAPQYGSGRVYDDLYVAQLRELLTGYGDLYCVWMDGANGEGPSGRRQQYDWARYVRVIRSLQPDAVVSICGPDVRWCGNEAGSTRPDEWSVVPFELQDAERTSALSQTSDDPGFSRRVRSDDDDLGSRAALEGYTGEPVWYPAEVDTSIRPGWFHHPEEDARVRSAEELAEIHRRSVGGNAMLLLNVPPTRAGRLAEPDRASLAGLGRLLRAEAEADLAPSAERTVAGEGTATPTVTLRWPEPRSIRRVWVGEDIAQGQRVEAIEVVADGAVVATSGCVGWRRAIEVPGVVATVLELRVTASRRAPVLERIAVTAG